MIIGRIRLFTAVAFAFVLSSCVSTSLEDAAPTALTVDATPTDISDNAIGQNREPSSNLPNETASALADTSPVTQANTDITTENIDQDTPPPKPEGEVFPSFAEEKRGETNQMTPQEKAAIQAQMTELLIQRTNDPQIKARYQRRLAYLRRLAKTHASDASAKIGQ